MLDELFTLEVLPFVNGPNWMKQAPAPSTKASKSTASTVVGFSRDNREPTTEAIDKFKLFGAVQAVTVSVRARLASQWPIL